MEIAKYLCEFFFGNFWYWLGLFLIVCASLPWKITEITNNFRKENKDGETYMLDYNVFNTDVCLCSTEYYNNPIDACYEMILKIHEEKIL